MNDDHGNRVTPTLQGFITRAVIGRFDMPDILFISATKAPDKLNRWNLTALDYGRTQFRVLGPVGSLAQHGYTSAEALEGRLCLVCCDVVMEAGIRLDLVGIEPPDAYTNTDWPMIVWAEYKTARALNPRRA